MIARRWVVAALVAALGCSHAPVQQGEDAKGEEDAGSGMDGGASGPCRRYGAPVRTGSNPSVLPELSGLAASAQHPGIYWAQNDSGNALELFAIREDGSVAARFPLTGASNVDVEDISLGPCPAGTCIVLADIGDNLESRADVKLYRLPEPVTLEDGARAVETMTFHYPDGAHNAESLVLDPADGTPWVVTKRVFSLGDVYRVDGSWSSGLGTAVKVATLPNPRGDQLSTAADVHPSGLGVLVRSYGHAWLYRVPAGAPLSEAWTATPQEVPAPSQPQSEAVAWLPDGGGYLVGSEGVGEGLFRVDCSP